MNEEVNISTLYEEYDLLEEYVEYLGDRGITDLFQTQKDAIRNGLLSEENFLMVAEPGTGKTLAAEFTIASNTISNSKDLSVFLVPYRALAEEKVESFREHLGKEFNLSIRGSLGGEKYDSDNLFDSNILVMTYEKFDYHLRNHPNQINNIGLVVIDEFQTLREKGRGPSLEILTTRLLTSYPETRVVGLSATTPNYESIADWLDGQSSYSGDWRKHPLHEGVYIKKERELNFEAKGSIEKIPDYSGNDEVDPLIHFLQKRDSNQALVLAQTRKKAEEIAIEIRDYIIKNPRSNSIEVDRISTTELKKAVKNKASGGELIEKLKKCIKHGIGFYHSGVSSKIKKELLSAVEEGSLRIVVSTTGLGAGVNLPIDRVFIPKPRIGSDDDEYGRDMRTAEYKNIAGRAGRPQYESNSGEAVLYADNRFQKKAREKEYLSGDIEHVLSQIDPQDPEIVLNILRDCKSVQDVIDFLDQSFFELSDGLNEEKKQIRKAVTTLSDYDMAEINEGNIRLTELGLATSKQLVSAKAVDCAIRYLNSLESPDELRPKELFILLSSTAVLDKSRLFSRGSGPDLTIVKQELPVPNVKEKSLKDAIVTAQVIEKWIKGADIEDSFREHDVYAKTKADVKEQIGPRLAQALKCLCEILSEAHEELADSFVEPLETLEAQVRYGLLPDKIPFAEHGITADKGVIRNLQQNIGINHPREIAEGDVSQLFGKMSGPEAYKITRKSINQFCESPEREQKQTLLDARAEDGPGIAKVRELFQSNHKEFERYCETLLEDIEGIQFEAIDETGQDRAAEGYLRVLDENREGIHKKDGVDVEVTVECKSKDDLKNDLVGTDDATDVVRKADGRPYQLTIGNPGFSDDAIDDAKRQGILLLTAPAFATLVIYTQKGGLSPADYTDIFTSEGKLYRSDIIRKIG